MRRYLTIGITKTGKVDLLHGAEKGFSVHRAEFHKLAAGAKKSKVASDYAEVQIIDASKGMIKRRRFGAVRVKGMDESGKRTVARTVKQRKPKAKKTAPKTAKKDTPARRSMREATSEKPAKSAAPAKADAAPSKDTPAA